MQIAVGIAGLLVGVAAIMVSVILARRYRGRRELSYAVSITPELLSISEEIKSGIDITYEGEKIENLSGATVTIRNTGNMGFRNPEVSETEIPITVDFGEGTRIIGEPRVTRRKPKDLQIEVIFPKKRPDPHGKLKLKHSGKFALKPVLLNPGQGASIFVLLNNFLGDYDFVAHIEHVETKEIKDGGDNKRKLATAASFVGSSGIAIIGVFTALGSTFSLSWPVVVLAFVGVLIAVTMAYTLQRS